MTGIKKQTHTHTYTHIKYKPWRKLGRILRGRCTRASRVPRGSIAGRGPWPTGTARWCPPEKHGWQFHSAPSVEEIAATNEIAQVARYHLSMEWEYESERWKGGGCGPIRWMEFTMEDKKRKRAEATHAPLPPFLSNFPAAACCPAKFNPRVLIFVEDAVSKWFPADRRRDALGHPLSLSSIKIPRRRAVSWTSFQSVMSPPTIQRKEEGKVFDAVSAVWSSCRTPSDRPPSLYWAVVRGFDV